MEECGDGGETTWSCVMNGDGGGWGCHWSCWMLLTSHLSIHQSSHLVSLHFYLVCDELLRFLPPSQCNPIFNPIWVTTKVTLTSFHTSYSVTLYLILSFIFILLFLSPSNSFCSIYSYNSPFTNSRFQWTPSKKNMFSKDEKCIYVYCTCVLQQMVQKTRWKFFKDSKTQNIPWSSISLSIPETLESTSNPPFYIKAFLFFLPSFYSQKSLFSTYI